MSVRPGLPSSTPNRAASPLACACPGKPLTHEASALSYALLSAICRGPCDAGGCIVNAEKSSMSRRKDKKLAEMIRGLRAKLGLTQEQFAAKVGVTWSTVNRWENSRGSPSPLAMRRIEELQGNQ